MMAVATAEAMDSVEGSHFANGRRHCCYQIGLEKTSKGFNEDVKNYSLSLFDRFCPVKRNSEYFAEKWSEQKVLIIKVAGLYST